MTPILRSSSRTARSCAALSEHSTQILLRTQTKITAPTISQNIKASVEKFTAHNLVASATNVKE